MCIHGLDLAAELIAALQRRRRPSSRWCRRSTRIRPSWIGKIEATPQAQLEQIQNLPTNQQFVDDGQACSGLQDWAAARGVPQAKSNQCLSDQKMIDREVQLTSDVNTQYPDFQGTPSFVINGNVLDQTRQAGTSSSRSSTRR